MQVQIYELKVFVEKFQMQVKFPCSMIFQLKNDSNIEEGKSMHQLKNGNCCPEQQFTMKIEIASKNGNYQDKNAMALALMASSTSKVPAGTAYIKITQNNKIVEYKDETVTLRLEKCPDPTAKITLRVSLKFLSFIQRQNKSKETMSQLNKLVKSKMDTQSLNYNMNEKEQNLTKKQKTINYLNPRTLSPPLSQASPRFSKKALEKSQYTNSQEDLNNLKNNYRNISNQPEYGVYQQIHGRSRLSSYLPPRQHIVTEQNRDRIVSPSQKAMGNIRQKSQYRAQIAKLRGQNLQLRKEERKQNFDEQLKNYKSEINNLDIQLKNAKQENQKNQKIIRTNVNEIKQIEKENKNILNKLKIRETANLQIMGLLEQKEQELIGIQHLNRKMKEEIEDIKLQKGLLDKRVNFKQGAYQQQIDKLAEKYQKSQLQRQKAVFELSQMLNNFQSFQKKHQGDSKQRETAFFEQKNKLLRTIEDLKEQITKIKAQNSSFRDKINQSETNTSHCVKNQLILENKVKVLTEQLADKEEELRKTIKSQNSLKNQQQQWKNLELSLRNQLRQLKISNQKLNGKIKQMKQHIKFVQKSIQIQKQQKKQLEQKLSKDSKQLNSKAIYLENKIKQKQQLLQQQGIQLERFQKQYEKLTNKHSLCLVQFQKQRENLNMDLQYLSKLKTQYQMERQELKEDARRNEESFTKKYVDKNQKLTASLQQFKEKLYQSETRVSQLDIKITKNEKQLTQARETLINITKDNDSLTRQIREIEEEQRFLKKQNRQQKNQIEGLRERLQYRESESQGSHKNYIDKLQKFSIENQKNIEQIITLKAKNSELTMINQGIIAEIQRRKTDQQYYKKYNEELEETITKHVKQSNIKVANITELSQKLEELKSSINHKDLQLTKLQQQQKIQHQKLTQITQNLFDDCSSAQQRYTQFNKKQMAPEQIQKLLPSSNYSVSIRKVNRQNPFEIIQNFKSKYEGILKKYSSSSKQQDQYIHEKEKLIQSLIYEKQHQKQIYHEEMNQLQRKYEEQIFYQKQKQDQLINQIKTLENNLREETLRKTNNSQELQHRMQELRGLQEQLQKIKRQFRDMKSHLSEQIDILNGKIVQKMKTISSLQGTISQLQNIKGRLNDNTKMSQQKIQNHQETIARLYTEITTLTQALNNSRTKVQQTQQIYKVSSEKIIKLEQQISNSKNLLALTSKQKQQNITKVEERLEKQKNYCKQLKQKIGVLNTQIDNLSKRNSDQNIQNSNLLSRLAEVKYDNSNKDSRIHELQHQIQIQRQKYYTLEEDSRDFKEQFHSILNIREITIRKLQQQLKQKKTKIQTNQIISSKNNKQIQGKQKIIEQLKSDLFHITEIKTDLEQQTRQLLQKVQKVSQQHTQSCEKILYLESLIQNTITQSNTTQNLVEKHLITIHNLQQQITYLTKQISMRIQQITSLYRQNQYLKHDRTQLISIHNHKLQESQKELAYLKQKKQKDQNQYSKNLLTQKQKILIQYSKLKQDIKVKEAKWTQQKKQIIDRLTQKQRMLALTHDKLNQNQNKIQMLMMEVKHSLMKVSSKIIPTEENQKQLEKYKEFVNQLELRSSRMIKQSEPFIKECFTSSVEGNLKSIVSAFDLGHRLTKS